MFKETRVNELLKYITEHDEASVSDLAKHFNVSTMTVRRDLAQLEQSELIGRTHGGAVALGALSGEEQYESKQTKNLGVKQRIAGKALSLVTEPPDGSPSPKSIFLDSGTTIFQLALLLKKQAGLKIFTNDLKTALELHNVTDVYMVGGRVQPETGCTIGAQFNAFIEAINIDICFMGVSAVSSRLILSSPSEEKALNKQMILNRSSVKTLVCDASKFNQMGLFNIASISAFDYVITDYELNPYQQNLIKDSGTLVMSA
jgi:DeoR/GlpR family transcriptional regulator of sugar metabolism